MGSSTVRPPPTFLYHSRKYVEEAVEGSQLCGIIDRASKLLLACWVVIRVGTCPLVNKHWSYDLDMSHAASKHLLVVIRVSNAAREGLDLGIDTTFGRMIYMCFFLQE